MGYEVKLYIGKISGGADKDGHYLQVVAMADLSNPGPAVYTQANLVTGKPVFIYYEGDSETRTLADCYGKRLTLLPIDDVIKALRKDAKRSASYRDRIALDLLEAAKKHDVSTWGELGVVCYGY